MSAQSISIEKPYPKDAWVGIFDKSIPRSQKIELLDALRSDFKKSSEESECTRDLIRLFEKSTPPNGIIVATIMVSAYPFSPKFYGYLNKAGISNHHIFLSYSSGSHSKDKIFSDGSEMKGKLYLPEADLKMLMQEGSRPVLLVDNVIETGVTVGTIASTLVYQLGHSGVIYQLIDHRGLSGSVLKCLGIISPGYARPIVTENGEVFGELKRGR